MKLSLRIFCVAVLISSSSVYTQDTYKEQDVVDASNMQQDEQQKMQLIDSMAKLVTIQAIKENAALIPSLRRNGYKDQEKIKQLLESIESCAQRMVPEMIEMIVTAMEEDAPTVEQKKSIIADFVPVVVIVAQAKLMEYCSIDIEVEQIIKNSRIQVKGN